MNKLISIIIPVYKVEKYLRKCVDSVINQTYKNLQIILVDDGSPDQCGKICDEYALQDDRIQVIHKKNGGLSDARNAGLNIMNGEYVAFVDSDDWIEPTMYETLFSLMEHFNADMAFGGVSDDLCQGEVTKSIKVSNYGNGPFEETNIEAMKRYFHGSWAAWDKLYKADLFADIRYPVGEINEDEAIVLQLLHKAKKVCYTNEIFYHYMKRVDGTSITTSAFSIKKLAWKNHCAVNVEFTKLNYPELEKDAMIRYRTSLLWSLTEIALCGDSIKYKNEINELMKELCENKNTFLELPFQHESDRIRLKILVVGGFNLYKPLINISRKMH